jgi:ParB-like chromosome segregation protein Spo0J
MEAKAVPIGEVKPNPDNPRFIRDEKFKKLVQSLRDFPEMAKARELIVNKDMIVLGGNMRLKAMQEAGWEMVPVKVVDWNEEKQREFVVKDNASYGEWDYDALGNMYEPAELEAWGVDLPDFEEMKEVEETDKSEVKCKQCQLHCVL